MQALVKRNTDTGLLLGNITTPKPGHHEVLIKILRTSLCGTDLQIYQSSGGAEAGLSLPLVVGHEFVGEIVEAGAGTSGYEKGQVVSGETHVACGQCRSCIEGHRHQCPETSYTGINRSGAFAEYITLPASAVWVHSPSIDLDIATLFEPLGNAVHATSQFELLGKAVLIIGASAEGLMAAAVCRHAGARQVVVIDRALEKLRLALTLGATHTINIDENNMDHVVAGLQLNDGFDICLEMSGNPDAYPTVFEYVKPFGEIVMMGVPDAPHTMDWRSVIFKQLTVKGVHGRSMPETWQQMSALIEGGLDLAPIITKRIHYTDFEEGFEALSMAIPGKVVMNWEEK